MLNQHQSTTGRLATGLQAGVVVRPPPSLPGDSHPAIPVAPSRGGLQIEFCPH